MERSLAKRRWSIHETAKTLEFSRGQIVHLVPLLRRLSREDKVIAVSQDLARGVHEVRDDKRGEVSSEFLSGSIDEVALFEGCPHFESLIPGSNGSRHRIPLSFPLYGHCTAFTTLRQA